MHGGRWSGSHPRLRTHLCLLDCWLADYNQPNGYLQITDSTIGVTPLGWVAAEGHPYPWNEAIALHIHYGSLDGEYQAGSVTRINLVRVC